MLTKNPNFKKSSTRRTPFCLVCQAAELEEAAVEGLVREFAASWKSGIEAINQDVLSFFSNFRNGMEILKQVMIIMLRCFLSLSGATPRSFGHGDSSVCNCWATAASIYCLIISGQVGVLSSPRVPYFLLVISSLALRNF